MGFSDIEVKVMRWYHHCFSYDYASGTYAMVLDKDLLTEGEHGKNLENLTRN